MIMGLAKRKTSGNIIGGSTLIVPGQPILSAKKFEVTFSNKRGSVPDETRQKNTDNQSTSGNTSN